jgi:hypothetical protein
LIFNRFHARNRSQKQKKRKKAKTRQQLSHGKRGIKNIISQRNKKQGTSSNLSETMSSTYKGKGGGFELTRKINNPFSWK